MLNFLFGHFHRYWTGDDWKGLKKINKIDKNESIRTGITSLWIIEFYGTIIFLNITEIQFVSVPTKLVMTIFYSLVNQCSFFVLIEYMAIPPYIVAYNISSLYNKLLGYK